MLTVPSSENICREADEFSNEIALSNAFSISSLLVENITIERPKEEFSGNSDRIFWA